MRLLSRLVHLFHFVRHFCQFQRSHDLLFQLFLLRFNFFKFYFVVSFWCFLTIYRSFFENNARIRSSRRSLRMLLIADINSFCHILEKSNICVQSSVPPLDFLMNQFFKPDCNLFRILLHFPQLLHFSLGLELAGKFLPQQKHEPDDGQLIGIDSKRVIILPLGIMHLFWNQIHSAS